MTLLSDNRTEEIISEEIMAAAEKVAYETLVYDEFDTECEVSLSFVSDEEIQEINKNFRDMDKATDVLSFPQIDFENDGVDLSDNSYKILGDIVISLERAKEQADEFGHSFDREIAFLTVHSMLHLLGYDHVNSEEEELDMRRRQSDVLKNMGLDVK